MKTERKIKINGVEQVVVVEKIGEGVANTAPTPNYSEGVGVATPTPPTPTTTAPSTTTPTTHPLLLTLLTLQARLGEEMIKANQGSVKARLQALQALGGLEEEVEVAQKEVEVAREELEARLDKAQKEVEVVRRELESLTPPPSATTPTPTPTPSSSSSKSKKSGEGWKITSLQMGGGQTLSIKTHYGEWERWGEERREVRHGKCWYFGADRMPSKIALAIFEKALAEGRSPLDQLACDYGAGDPPQH